MCFLSTKIRPISQRILDSAKQTRNFGVNLHKEEETGPVGRADNE